MNSSQSNEKDRMIPYVPPLGEVRILQFEDTLLEEDHRNFNLIYESLLLEGKAGNLTDLTLGMVLAEKPQTGLQVMHERLKHLIITSENFKEKKRAEHGAQARGRQISRGKGVVKHSKGIRFLWVSGKGKRLWKSNNRTRIIPCHTSRNEQASGMSCSVLFESACVDFSVPLLFYQ